MAGSSFGSRAIYPSRFVPYLIVLVISKLFRSFGIFLSFDLLKLIHIVQFLFLVKAGYAVLLVFLQKPFLTGKRLSKHQWFRVTRHAFFSSAIHLLWLFGLTLCGPLRTLLLFEHSDLAIIAAITALVHGTGGPAKTRGAFFFIVAVMGLLLFDHDDFEAHIQNHPGGHLHSSIITHLFDHLTTLTGLSDHKGGVVLLSLCLCLQVGFNSASKKLSIDIGGSKRLNALSTIISAVIISPWALMIWSTRETPVDSALSLVVPLACVILFVFLIDYYVEAVCVTRIDAPRTACVGSMATFLAALMLSCIWTHPFIAMVNSVVKMQEVITEEHMLSGGVVFSFVLFMFSTHILTSASKTSKGSLIGYSSSGLPLYSFTSDALHRTSQSVLTVLRNGLRQILEESDSRKIFYFLCVNLSFTFVELAYGAWTNSLGLISDGFHMLFDCSALVMGLYAAIMTRWKATRIFSYGYDRVEILSGFINGLFLIVIAFFVFTAALGRIFDPPEINTDRLLTVSVAGLVVNLFGIFAFRHAHSHGGGHGHSHGGGHGHSHGGGHGHSHGGSGGSHGHSHGSEGRAGAALHGHSHNTNMEGTVGELFRFPHARSRGMLTNETLLRDGRTALQPGVFLHVLADTLGSCGVIVSTLLIENFDLKIADPICSIFIAVLIFFSVIPLVKETSLILLLRTPEELQDQLGLALQKVLAVDGVLSYRGEHFWRHSSTVICGTIHLQVTPSTGEQQVIKQVSSIFKEEGVNNLTIQVEKETFFQHMSGLGVTMDEVYEMTRNFKALNCENTADFIKSI